MASVAGRHIDTRFQSTSILNKSASESSSLYQKCASLLDKLLRIRGFTEFFPELTSSSDSKDPVTQIWDILSTGTPLCYIFDQLPPEDGLKQIGNYSLQQNSGPSLDRAKKRAIALFVMQLREEKLLQKIPECEMFMVTDLWNRHSTNGLVKAVNTVTAIVNYLPKSAFHDDQISVNPTVDTNEKNGPQTNIIREMLETERKYVQDLETMQKFSTALSQSNIIDQDTIHLLFPNLNQLVNFQRKFLIRLEFTAQLPLKVQRWGQQFLEYEEEFSVYEPYCLNYKKATELMVGNERTLIALNHMIDVKRDLPALLLKPIQRVCQYPLLLDSLAKAFAYQGYDYQYELIRGSEAAKRIIDRINEAQRREENQEIVKNLKTRIKDWKGHSLEAFGDLLLHDVFVVNKSNIDRVYVTYLFQQMLILCKVDRSNTKGARRTFTTKEWLAISNVMGSTPLFMKGRIFMRNIVSASPVQVRNNPVSGQYPLLITWKADDGIELFTMKCTRHEQMKQWEETMTRIIQSYKSTPQPPQPERPPEDPPLQRRLRLSGTPPPLDSRYSTVSNSTLPLYSPHKEEHGDWDEVDSQREEQPDDQELVSDDENDLEDYPPPSYPPSGRETPVENRTLTRSRSLPSRFRFQLLGRKAGLSSKNNSGGKSPRTRSNSLPPGMLIFPDTTSDPSDNERTPPKTPQFSNNRSLPSIQEDLFQSSIPSAGTSEPVNLKLKMHFREDIFLLLVSRTITYDDLKEKIKRKCRLCGDLPDGPLKIKYKDEDGDLVSLISTEDVQLAFDQLASGRVSFVSLYVS